jgi:hypothetical protein
MDLVQILIAAGIPHAVAWGSLIMAACSVLAALLPHPAPGSPLALPRNAIDTLAATRLQPIPSLLQSF